MEIGGVARIYVIKGPEENRVYIGSTTMPLRCRMNSHRSDARSNKNQFKLYEAMRRLGVNAFTIHELVVVAEEERYKAEGAHILAHKAHIDGYNALIPGRTNADRRRAWRAAHPELVKAQRTRRAQRQAERRRVAASTALVVHPEHREERANDAREDGQVAELVIA